MKYLISALLLLSTLGMTASKPRHERYFRWTQYMALSTLVYSPASEDYFDRLILDDIPIAPLTGLYSIGYFSHYRGRQYFNGEIAFAFGTEENGAADVRSILRKQYYAFRFGYNPVISDYLLLSVYTGLKMYRVKHKTDTPEGFGWFPDYSSHPLHRVRMTQFVAPIGLQFTIPLFTRRTYIQCFGEYLLPLHRSALVKARNLDLDKDIVQPFDVYSIGIGLGLNFDSAW